MQQIIFFHVLEGPNSSTVKLFKNDCLSLRLLGARAHDMPYVVRGMRERLAVLAVIARLARKLTPPSRGINDRSGDTLLTVPQTLRMHHTDQITDLEVNDIIIRIGVQPFPVIGLAAPRGRFRPGGTAIAASAGGAVAVPTSDVGAKAGAGIKAKAVTAIGATAGAGIKAKAGAGDGAKAGAGLGARAGARVRAHECAGVCDTASCIMIVPGVGANFGSGVSTSNPTR